MSRFDLFYVVVDERDEYLDTNIAKHIINMHRKREAAIKPHFSQKEILIYLKSCRTIKPVFTHKAAQILREEYVKMRANDGTSKKTSYRMTVRQLESTIRLSEALAKVHADDRVRPEYVQEACRLLQKSIITIKKEGVEMDDDQQVKFDENFVRAKQTDGQQPMEVEGEPQKKTTVKLSFEEYDKIGKQLVSLIQDNEKTGSAEMKQADLIEKFLTLNEVNIQSTDQLEQEMRKLNSVINRLITREGVLVIIDENQQKEERTLALNVNISAGNISLN